MNEEAGNKIARQLDHKAVQNQYKDPEGVDRNLDGKTDQSRPD